MKLYQVARRLLIACLPSMRKLDAALASATQRVSSLEAAQAKLSGQLSALGAENLKLRAAQLWTPENIGYPPLLYTPWPISDEQQHIVDRFHNFMYETADRNSFRSYFVSWLGYGMFKWPTDLWNYQEILTQTKPDFIIETGTHRGGSALFFATICDLLGHGEVITIDVDEAFCSIFPRHPRINYIKGSSVDTVIVDKITLMVGQNANIIVILDSDHRCEHVLEELRIYSKFIPYDGHLIVEDTNINGHPTYPEFGPGPLEAVEIFLAENPDFYADRSQERFYWTHNPKGFLRRRPP